MVMLGAFIKKSNLVSTASLMEGLKSTLGKKPKLIEINEKALQSGYSIF
jgi:Pyruvate/2-oxoacid:ferredoxin oxidoreductase gamma subunit